MGAQHEPVQPYLIESKMEQLLHDFAESTEHIVTKLPRFHIEFEGTILLLMAMAEPEGCW